METNTKPESLSLTSNTRFQPTNIASYSATPFYRRHWIFVVMLLFVTPIALLIVASGPIYAQRDNAVVEYSAKQKKTVIICCCVLFVLNLIALTS